jgi:hypothetical protein
MNIAYKCLCATNIHHIYESSIIAGQKSCFLFRLRQIFTLALRPNGRALHQGGFVVVKFAEGEKESATLDFASKSSPSTTQKPQKSMHSTQKRCCGVTFAEGEKRYHKNVMYSN